MPALSWMRTLATAALGILTFELVGQFAFIIRPLSPYPILSALPADREFLTDDDGFRGAIDRGHTRKWAAIGTSFTLNDTLPHDEVWSTILQHKIQREEIHLKNYSSHGGYRVLSGAIRLAAEKGERFEKLFISLTLRRMRPGDKLPYPDYFYSSTFHSNYPSKSWNQILTLIRDFRDTRLFSLLQPQPLLNPAGSEVGNLDLADDIHLCYRKTMAKNQCQERFLKSVDLQGIDDKRAFESVYLSCQRDVDAICGVPRRTTEMVATEFQQWDSYRSQITELIKLAQPLTKEIFLVSQGIYRNPDRSLRVLAKNAGVSAAFMPELTTFRALTTEASHQNAMRKNDEIRLVAKTFANIPKVKFLDFQELVDSLGSNGSTAYLDYAHLSPAGNRIYADYLFEHSKSR